MSITANFPAIRPTLNLDFVNSQTVDPRITFTRASTATYFDRLGVLRTAAINEPRIDFDPVTLACRGLLIEEQRTNLLLRSQEFDNAYWVRARIANVVPNAAIAPDGTLTACKIVEDTASISHYINSQFSTSGTLPTASVYVKAAERTYCTFQLIKDSGAGFAASSSFVINLVNGSFTGGDGSNPTVTSAGNGWWRISLTATDATSTNFGVRIGLGIPSGNYTGDGTSGIYIWGAQLEAGPFPTSYIPTTSSQVTRSADSAVMTGTNFSSWYRQDEGTLFADASVDAFSKNSIKDHTALSVNDGPLSNFFRIRSHSIGNGKLYVDAYSHSNGVSVADFAGLLYDTSPVSFREALSYDANSFSFSANGSIEVDSTISLPVGLNRMVIGETNIHIRRIAYWPVRLPNAQLQALTA